MILLVIDGMCSPLCAEDLLPDCWGPWERCQFGWNSGWISTALGRQLCRLGQVADVRWCSGWGEEAARFGEAFDLHAPWVQLEAGDLDRMWKLSAVDQALPGHPVWWIDDEHDHSSSQWAEDRTAQDLPTNVVRCDSNVGTTAGHIEAAARWAVQVSRT